MKGILRLPNRKYVWIDAVPLLWIMVVSSGARPQDSDELVSFVATNVTLGAKEAITSKRNVARERTRILTRPPFRGNSDSNEHDIIFPDSFEDAASSSDYLPPPSCDEHSTFCEKVENYPQRFVNDIIRRKDIRPDYFGTDESPEEIANRHAKPEEEMFLCPSVQKVIYPQVAKTRSNEWKYIINQPSDGYKQGVRIETCRKANGPCDLLSDLPEGITTKCKQKYVYRRLMSISQKGQPASESFLMPSACCCAYSRMHHFLSRVAEKP